MKTIIDGMKTIIDGMKSESRPYTVSLIGTHNGVHFVHQSTSINIAEQKVKENENKEKRYQKKKRDTKHSSDCMRMRCLNVEDQSNMNDKVKRRAEYEYMSAQRSEQLPCSTDCLLKAIQILQLSDSIFCSTLIGTQEHF